MLIIIIEIKIFFVNLNFFLKNKKTALINLITNKFASPGINPEIFKRLTKIIGPTIIFVKRLNIRMAYLKLGNPPPLL